MDTQLYNALIVLGIAICGGLGTLITALIAWLSKQLSNNTRITTEAKEASNGRLAETLDRLAVERNLVIGLRSLIRERDDRIAYIVSRMPEAEAVMNDYANRRTQHATEADEAAAERHVLQD